MQQEEETESIIPDEDYQISDNNLNYFTDMDFQ